MPPLASFCTIFNLILEYVDSILEHFEELFVRLFGSKNAPGATSDRFFGEVRDSVNTLVFTIHSKGSPGPELTKKQLRG